MPPWTVRDSKSLGEALTLGPFSGDPCWNPVCARVAGGPGGTCRSAAGNGGEGIAVSKAGIEGDVSDPLVGGGQDFPGPFRPQVEQEFEREGPGGDAKPAQKGAD